MEDINNIRRLIEELEKENNTLREKEKKQELGKLVLTYLQKGGSASDEVIRALEDVKNEYYEFERYFSPQNQRETIRRVRRLKEQIDDSTIGRNISGGAGIATGAVQLLCLSNPVAFTIFGIGTAACYLVYANEREKIERSTREVVCLLERDADRFRSLVRAVEKLDRVWRNKFAFSIHTGTFREICNESYSTLKVSDNKLKNLLLWFGVKEKWANINIAVSSHYLLAVVGGIGILNAPLAAGLLGICQTYLLINDLSEDDDRMSVIDQGISRMEKQYKAMQNLM